MSKHIGGVSIAVKFLLLLNAFTNNSYWNNKINCCVLKLMNGIVRMNC